MTAALKSSLAHWPELSKAVFVPHTEVEYERLVALLDKLVDEVGNNESHPLASLMEVISLLIEKYEDAHVPELESSAVVREDPPAIGMGASGSSPQILRRDGKGPPDNESSS